jgi:hypothetical protein
MDYYTSDSTTLVWRLSVLAGFHCIILFSNHFDFGQYANDWVFWCLVFSQKGRKLHFKIRFAMNRTILKVIFHLICVLSTENSTYDFRIGSYFDFKCCARLPTIIPKRITSFQIMVFNFKRKIAGLLEIH